MSDQLFRETSNRQYTTLTTERHPCPRCDSNPQSQQASGRRPTPYISFLNSFKIVIANKNKDIGKYKNISRKLPNCNANIFCNQKYLRNDFIPNYTKFNTLCKNEMSFPVMRFIYFLKCSTVCLMISRGRNV